MCEECLCIYCNEKSFRECPALFEDTITNESGVIIECNYFTEMEAKFG